MVGKRMLKRTFETKREEWENGENYINTSFIYNLCSSSYIEDDYML
jgi:hypothetical protein